MITVHRPPEAKQAKGGKYKTINKKKDYMTGISLPPPQLQKNMNRFPPPSIIIKQFQT